MGVSIYWINAGACVAIAAALAWGVLSPRVRDGVVIKSGLILMTLGFSGTAWVLGTQPSECWTESLCRSLLLVHGGLIVVLAGWVLRTRAGRIKRRRAADWADFR